MVGSVVGSVSVSRMGFSFSSASFSSRRPWSMESGSSSGSSATVRREGSRKDAASTTTKITAHTAAITPRSTTVPLVRVVE